MGGGRCYSHHKLGGVKRLVVRNGGGGSFTCFGGVRYAFIMKIHNEVYDV